MEDIIAINKAAYEQQLILRHNLYLTTKISNIIVFSLITIICFINYLRVIGG